MVDSRCWSSGGAVKKVLANSNMIDREYKRDFDPTKLLLRPAKSWVRTIMSGNGITAYLSVVDYFTCSALRMRAGFRPTGGQISSAVKSLAGLPWTDLLLRGSCYI